MKKWPFIIIATFLLLNACIQRNDNQKLLQAEEWLKQELKDSANKILCKIDTTSLSNDDKIMYAYLNAICQYNLSLDTCGEKALTRSINYFKQHNDKERLARAYLYRGSIFCAKNMLVKAIQDLKNAQFYAQNTNDIILKIRIQAYLSINNSMSGNYQTAMAYSKRALEDARKINNKRWMAYFYDNIAVLYADLWENDSADTYNDSAMLYIKYTPLNEQPYLLNNAAFSLWRRHYVDSAFQLLQRSLAISPLPETYGKLARLYTKIGEYKKAEKLWKNALTTTQPPLIKMGILEEYQKWLEHEGLHDSAKVVGQQYSVLKDSFFHYQPTEEVRLLQDRYDHEKTISSWEYYLVFIIVFFVAAAIVAIAYWGYHQRKRLQLQQQLTNSQQLIDEYSKKIERLQQNGHAQNAEIKKLQQKIDNLRKEQIKIFSNGKQRYDQVRAGDKIVSWHKLDYNYFIEYYRTIDPSFVLNMEQCYQRLTAIQKFILIMQHMGYDDEYIKDAMGVSAGAYRMQRSRIKKVLSDDDELL